jgi:dihydropyrimidinase
MGVTRFDADSVRQLREIVAAGVGSFKVFLAYKGAFGVDDAELWNTLSLARDLGVVVTAHCENETLVAEMQRRLLAAGRTGPDAPHDSRPWECCPSKKALPRPSRQAVPALTSRKPGRP